MDEVSDRLSTSREPMLELFPSPPRPKKKYFSSSEADGGLCFLDGVPAARLGSASLSSQDSSTMVCKVKSMACL